MKKKTGRMISLILVVLLLIGLTGCNGSQKPGLDSILSETADYLIEANPNPGYGSVGGEWLVFGIARWDRTLPQDGWFENYYTNVEDYVDQCNGNLDVHKNTEYSRVILTLTAIGKDPTNVAGWDLLEPLADFDATVFQGINGPVYALLALDSGNYEIPKLKSKGTQATREMYVDYILSKELPNGGWSFSNSKNADVDLTAMVLQALAKYRNRSDVQAAVDRGVDVLASLQSNDGGFSSFGEESSESVSQVILALSELSISINDSRFVKDGKTLVDRLMEFRADGGGFKHTINGEYDAMATEQAFYALTGLHRVQEGLSTLFVIE